MSEKKGRLSKEQKESNIENIGKIVNLTAEIKMIVEMLYGETYKSAYISSVQNLEKKNAKYLSSEPFRITAEEKTLLEKIRAGKIDISTLSSSDERADESISEISETGMGKEIVEYEEKAKTNQKKARR